MIGEYKKKEASDLENKPVAKDDPPEWEVRKKDWDAKLGGKGDKKAAKN